MTAAEGPASDVHASGRDQFRPDLEGLRGLAILLVLLFHAGIPGVVGGFIGVDVFFVLSGFLITGLLIRERELTGRVSLGAFYARRARRILPAALVVVVGTLVAATFFLPPLDLLRTADDAAAVALSVGNIRFAVTATDYFAIGQVPSPFLHYWSLGVEEQFYLVWPAVLILATRFGRPRLGAGLTLAIVVVASAAFAVWLTAVSAPWAFYSLPTRAWQLGLGGLIAIVAERPPAGRWQRPAVLAGWIGLGAVLASGFVIDAATTPYPGIAAFLPTVGAAGLLVAGTGAWSPGRLLALAPMRFLGRISYSLYLVHWPILVLPASTLAIDESLPLEVRLGLAGLSIVAGAICWRVVEQPFQRSPRFRARPLRALGIAATAIATTLIAVVAVSGSTSQALDSALTAAPVEAAPESLAPGSDPTEVALASPAPSSTSSPAPVPTSSALLTPAPPPSGSASPGAATAQPTVQPTAGPTPAAPPTLVPTPGPTEAATPISAPAATPPPAPTLPPATGPPGTPRPTEPPPDPNAVALPANVRPPLRAAASDRERLAADGCELGNTPVVPPACVYGNRNGSFVVALVGDSHAAQWFPALEIIANRNGWRLVVFTKISCRFLDLPIYSRDLKREYTECEQWRLNVVSQLQQLHPDLVVVSAARGMATVNPSDDNPTRQGEAMARLLNQVPGRKAILVDTPQARVDVPPCLSGHVNDTRACDTPRSTALNWRYLLLERAAAAGTNGSVINLTDSICRGDTCPAVRNGMIVFRDVFHLTATFAASLADDLEGKLRET